MVRNVLYEKSFAERFIGLSRLHCAVLLSGLVNDEEYLFLPIELPPKDEADDSGQRKAAYLQSIRHIDETWVALHCKNLNRMIPGGVRISGICLVASLTEFNSAVEHIKKILLHLPKYDTSVNEAPDLDSPERILLLVDPSTKKFSCMVFDVTSPSTGFRSVPIKLRSFLSSCSAFKTYISLSLETVLPADRKKEEILLELQAAAKPYLQSLLTDAKLLIDGEFREDAEQVLCGITESVSASVGTKKSHKKAGKTKEVASKSGLLDIDVYSGMESAAEKSVWAPVELAIFGPQFPRWQRASSSSSLDSGTSSETGCTAGTDGTDSSSSSFVPINRLVVSGRIPGIAFLPSTTTVHTLFQALRKDLVQGILARLELLSDELHITCGELEVPRIRLPQRVLVRLPACPTLPLSDYKFLSETADDVVSRLHYFCMPIGVHGCGGAMGDSRDTSSFTTGLSSSDQCSIANAASYLDQIDASCLDTSLEKDPNDSADEYSGAELIEDVAQTVQPVTQFISLSNPLFLALALVSLVGAILVSFLLVNSRRASGV